MQIPRRLAAAPASSFSSTRFLAAALAALLPACVAEGDHASEGGAPPEPATAAAESELLDGAYDALLRPEIGFLSFSYGGCTGTLVDRSIVLTAAHCVRYTSGPTSGSFLITTATGSTAVYSVDRSYSIGAGNPNDLSSGLGSTDVALVHLSSPVSPAHATPTSIFSQPPAPGTLETIFGYGCQDRGTKTGAGSKQYIDATVGVATYQLCPGDSGGPAVWYGPHDNGWVFAVASGYDWLGRDLFGDAATHGIAAVEAVKRFPAASTLNLSNSWFASQASSFGVRAVTGDFNGDSFTDIALLSGDGWSTIPIAFSNGNGAFNLTNFSSPTFATWSREAGQVVSGDFNGDGRTDLALSGRAGWNTIPVAFSNGNGTFNITNFANAAFAGWAAVPGAQLLAGNFNGAGGDDLALVGGQSWSTVPLAFSNGNGTFALANTPNATFASWAQTPGARALAGDFNGDGRADIALTGASGWSTIPLSLSNGDGSFSVVNNHVEKFPTWAASDGKLITGDFDGDGRADLGKIGVPGWVGVAFAFSTGNGAFTAGNLPMSDFPAWATSSYFALPGRFKPHSPGGDGKRDIALLGGSGWTTIPVAFLRD